MSETEKKDALQVLRRKKRLKGIIGILVLIIIAGIGGTVYMNRSQEKPVEGPANQIVQVQKTNMTESLKVTGTVQASKEVNINFTNVEGAKLIAVNVKAGDSVKAGQVLARLDDSDSKLQIKNAESNVAIARAKVEEAKRGPKSSDIELQKANVLKAQMAIKTAKDSMELEEVAAQKVAAKMTLDKAQKDYDDQTYLVQNEAAAESDLATAKQNLDKAKLDMNNVELQYKKARNRQVQAIEDAEMGYKTALIQLKAAQSPPDASNIQSAQASLQQAETELEQKKSVLNKLQVTAPWDGIILKVNGDVGTSPTAPFIVMNNSNTGVMKVSAKVNESDIAKMRTGLQATLHTNSFPDKQFKGEVLFVSPEPVTESNVTTYKIELSLDSQKIRLQPGMNMDVSLLLAEHKDALSVPLFALRSEGGVDGVYVAKNPANPADYEFRPVKLGVYTADQAEIKSGVKEGETIVIPPQGGSVGPNGSQEGQYPDGGQAQ
ncbi:efflux RND transporter periplasmic adaptor subunit [Paenibacillus polymyxa]|uniref:efflux RND transporter periplasmic adaptor subunit n=1 Tax=Paenibacillus polymyxa TaxID=1406 RepID=UPI002AB480AC|nr:efflux RND transporter periplasmic adaptor subunit [Paenibacillus polymyxa]MDY7993838.1 efflux RND transporter periplasmic adaptor subunit [Paenibacillus polymyxa]MDY8120616.1 efflux RND transporter periplasmic adaptor subunit [Paenibacillus polymyxa]